jgi:NADH-quinone oxidoreductase subunit G
MNRALFEELGLREGDALRVRQGSGEALVSAGIDDRLPGRCIRLAAARPETAGLGALFGTLTAERVAAQRRVAV